MSEKKESYFWTSYSDLMTSLFFVMMVLFLLAMAVMQNKINESEDLRRVTEEQLKKITEINKSIEYIDKRYFVYDKKFKRHTLKDIQVKFKAYSSDINDISSSDKDKLFNAGKAIREFIKKANKQIPEARYLLIVEGQSSKDWYTKNNELSYERALHLVQYWRREVKRKV